jgi:hypothetical protein
MSAKDNTSLKDTPIQSVVPSESTPIRVMSNDDSMIADLVAEQPTLDQIAQLKISPRAIPNLLEFPEEVLAKHGKEYHFAWLTKGKDLTVKLRTSGWVLCNRTNSPWIKEHRFSGHGAVEQAGMLLVFMRKDMADKMYGQAAIQSQAKVKHYTEGMFKQQDKDAPAQFYKPEDKGVADD